MFGFFLSILFLADIFLQGYLRKMGFGVMNTGISFGWFSGLNVWWTLVVYLGFVIYGVRFLDFARNDGVYWGLFALALGGMGNIIMRLVFGGVWDYLYFPVLGFWFNLSDALITGGIISYMWCEIATSSTPRNDGVY